MIFEKEEKSTLYTQQWFSCFYRHEQLIIVLGELTRVAGRCNPSCCQTICRNEVVGRIRALLDAPFAKLRPYKRFTWNRNWPLHNKSFKPTHKKITLIRVLYSCLKPSVLLLFFFFLAALAALYQYPWWC